MDNRKINILDLMNVFELYLSFLNYDLNLEQASNDDILGELKAQNTKYFKRIIEQNEEILKLLRDGRVENGN